jgi:hypothetical protein
MKQAITQKTVDGLNYLHQGIEETIRLAYPDSEALRLVAEVQYWKALTEVGTAIDKLMDIHQRMLELATGNAPCAELDELKADLNL